MGKDAEKKDDIEEVNEDQVVADGEAGGEEPRELAADEDAGAVEEIEVVRENTRTLDQDTFDGAMKKRVKKLNTKVDVVTEQANRANDDLAVANERNKILELALQQSRGSEQAVEPNPDNFDGGYDDPEFRKKQAEYTQAAIQIEVQRQVSGAQTNLVNSNKANEKSQELERKQIKHYQRADKIGAKDYGEVEDVAIGVLGQDVSNQIIANFDNSHVMLYYLGKNKPEAERLSNLITTNPIKGIAEVGRLEAELKVKPKRTSDTPEPDEELVGGSASETSMKKLAKLRQAVQKGDDPQAMNKLRDYKRSQREKA